MEGEGEGLIEREGVLGLITMFSLLFVAYPHCCVLIVSLSLDAPIVMPLFPVLVDVWLSCIVVTCHFSMWLLWCLVSVSWEG